MVEDLITSLSPGEMDRTVEIKWRPGATARFVLLHMLRHRHYHTGQLNILRRLLGLEM